MKEQEVIKRLNFHKEYVRLYSSRVVMISETDLETVLNMLKEKDKLYHKALGDLVKADRENIQLKKQIDLMAERIEWLCKRNGILLDREYNENFTQEDIKQYFERKVKKCTEDD